MSTGPMTGRARPALPLRLPGASLRLRLIGGAAALAALAIFAAFLAAYGARASADLVDRATEAQHRLELYSSLSGRIGDYAVVAVETAADAGGGDEGRDRRATRADAARDAFARADAALADAVLDARSMDENEQMLRATASLNLARMRALFDAFIGDVESAERGEESAGIAPALNGFSTRFSPLLNHAIEEERRARDAATGAARALRDRLAAIGAAAALAAPLLLWLFYLAMVRPLLRRIEAAGRAAESIGAERREPRAALRPARDELGLLFARIERTARRLSRQRVAVDRDRARLSEIVAERTAALEAANARLSAVDAERRRFFADVGHELRTPLTAILAESQLGLAAARIEEEEARAALGVIRARAGRLNRRIDDLLRLARSETGRLELESRPYSLADAARGALEDAGPGLRARGVRFTLEAGDEPVALGDADWTRQVIAGLLDNAARHAEKGGCVEIAVRRDGGRAIVEVADDGPGVPEAERERIFERFERGARAERGGFGVGLALGAWVMGRQGGRLALVGGPPGARFALEAPLAELEARDGACIDGETGS